MHRRASISKESAEIADRIRKSNEAGKHSLDLTKLNLDALPFEALVLDGLRELHARKNRFRSIEPMLRFQYLESLDVSFNPMDSASSMWDGLAQMQLLKSLSLTGTGISVLPESIRQLSLLESLAVARNKLSALPEWLGIELERLSTLDAAHNSIQSVPSSLEGAKSLRILHLEGNPCVDAIQPGTRLRFLVDKVNFQPELCAAFLSNDSCLRF